MYNAIDVARYIIEYEAMQRRSVSNLRLQKLLYFIQVKFLVTKGVECFSDRIEAWDFGPVVPNVYREFKLFGSSSIPRSLSEGRRPLAKEDELLVNSMLNSCAALSTSTLVSRTHHQKPWQDAYNSFDNTIYPQAIKEYFCR